MSEVKEVKPGRQTSEFVGLIIYAAVVVLNGTGQVTIPEDQILALGGALGIYTAGRSYTKGKA